MIISFSASVTGINTLLSKKFAWKVNDLSTENLLDPVLNYTEQVITLTAWFVWFEHISPHIATQDLQNLVFFHTNCSQHNAVVAILGS